MKITEDLNIRNEIIEKALSKGNYSWEDDNTISIDGECIFLNVGEY